MEEQETRLNRKSHKDHGYAWLVMVCAFLFSALNSGTFVSYGVFFPEYVEYFRKSKAEVAVIGSFGMGLSGIIGIFLGSIAKRFGYRAVLTVGGLCVSSGLAISSVAYSLFTLYFTQGLLLGLGLGCNQMGVTLSLLDYFEKRLSFALGVQAAGFSAGVFAVPQLIRLMIDTYTWRGGLLLFAGFQLHSLILAVIMKPSYIRVTKQSKNQKQNNDESTDRKSKKCHCSFRQFIDYTILKDKKAVIMFVAIGCSICGHFIPYLLLPARMISYGIEKTKAAFLVSLMGICSGLTRPVAGLIADKMGHHRTLLVACSSLVVGFLGVLSYFFTQYVSLAVIFGLCGFLSAGYMSLYAVLMADIVPPNKLEHGSGILLTFVGGATLLATPFAGYLVDTTKNYATPFLVLGGVQLFSGLLFIILYVLQRLMGAKETSIDTSIEEKPIETSIEKKL